MIQIVAQRDGGFFHPVGFPTGLQVESIAVMYKQLPQILAKLGPQNLKNMYYTVGHHNALGGHLPSRTGDTFEMQTVLPFDIDKSDGSRAMEYAACVAKVLEWDVQNLIVNATGNGVHVLAHLKTPIRSTKYLKELKPCFNEFCYRIAKELKARGLPFDKVDPVIYDAARVLRLPGTINSKPGKDGAFIEKDSVNVQYSDATLDADLMKLSGVDVLRMENISVDEIRRSYPTPDFEEIAKECRFIQWATVMPEQVHEPHLFDLISLLAAQLPSKKIVVKDLEMNAKEVAQHVFNHASASQSLARSDFDSKWEAGSRYGARKCSTVAINAPDSCKTCPHSGLIPTPLALKSKDHIGSESLGYWVLNAKGSPTHPHYGDLAKVYGAKHTFVTAQGARIFTFGESHYSETEGLQIKAWMERTMVPQDPIRREHRGEFLAKVEVVGALSEKAEEDLFDRSIRGKLNCRNGVVDIVKGEMIPHSPQMGFKYVLPYDYVEGEASELFLDWLGEMMQNREELMDSLLDLMAYILWPNYDDHVFAFFVGGGANGKSTLMHLIQAMVGEMNYCSVSLQQLGANRFAPANLEGKLVNLSEESSGYEMGFEELNIVQALSSGSPIDAERKNVQGFTFKNKAKLIFSANKAPVFKESGHSIRRRMLVIPFDHTINSPDSRIEEKLIAEVPKIVSMLVRRIQENTKANGGRFIVSRGGAEAQKAQDKLLLAGNSVIEWAKECVESSAEISEEQYVSASEAYSHYKNWCDESNYRAYNKGIFAATMYNSFVTPAVDKSNNRVRVGGKQVRVFKRTKWKELEE